MSIIPHLKKRELYEVHSWQEGWKNTNYWTNVGADDASRIVIKDYLIENDSHSAPTCITLANSVHLFEPHFYQRNEWISLNNLY